MPLQYAAHPDTAHALPPAPLNLPDIAGPRTILPNGDYTRPLFFPLDCLNRFLQPHAWLNDDCINLGAQAILRHLGSTGAQGSIALFSSYVYPSHRVGDDDALWRNCRYASHFWEKDLWLIPIHHNQNHWTLSIIYWRKKRIAHFDSLSSTEAFEYDVQVCKFAAWDLNYCFGL